MGWASGSQLAESLWHRIRDYIPKDKRTEVADQFIEEFEDFDCDTMYEAETLYEDAGRP